MISIATSSPTAKKAKKTKDTNMDPEEFIGKHCGYHMVFKAIMHGNVKAVKYMVDNFDIDPSEKWNNRALMERAYIHKEREIDHYLEGIVKERKE